MSFDAPTRTRLAAFVRDARELLTAEFTQKFQELYGITADGRQAPMEQLAHLDENGRATATLLRERIAYLVRSHPEEAGGPAAAVARLAREQAFTVLNRLAALRLAEKRGLILESVGKGYQSTGFRLYETPACTGLGDAYHRYRQYLFCLFDELALDLGVLFNRHSPLGLLFPREACLLSLLDQLHAPELDPLWAEDETIGWIYQYYNDEAERKKMRKESSAPRSSRELAVRNQFFTPRYVVEFLTDNTLGRLWYEMRQGETRLKEQCRYLVSRPTEIFLNPGESAPESAKAGENLSQEELLRQPVHIPHRPLKDPREIRLLDPACGSMHFGLYAFDLFTVIYDEAWEIAHGPDNAAKSAGTFAPFVAFTASFPDKAAFLREVPRLIVEHNLHGIDIDPRAAQIAGLSLWLRAQRAWHQAGVKPADRPRITRSNLVCAEPMPGEKELLREFVEQQFPAGERPAFAFLLDKIFDRMTLAGEAGSLLRIEEEIRAAIAEARALAQSQSAPRQARLFPSDERSEQAEFDLRGLNDEQFWQAAEQRIYDALEAYTEQAANGGGFQRRLFAHDAAQGFAFIDLCRKRYDVVVMNPPYGAATETTDDWIREVYPDNCNDLYAAFSQRAFEMTVSRARPRSPCFRMGDDRRGRRVSLV
ncbi:MAG: SAM-dependent methyltransferase [Verrucomicrobiales bacterium]|nr:SAM-dependent methyltransferase [Verrucomicrobiales bacterium]